MEYAEKGPAGLLDRFRLAMLEAERHLEQYGDGVDMYVRMYRHPQNTPTQWKLEVKKVFRPA